MTSPEREECLVELRFVDLGTLATGGVFLFVVALASILDLELLLGALGIGAPDNARRHRVSTSPRCVRTTVSTARSRSGPVAR